MNHPDHRRLLPPRTTWFDANLYEPAHAGLYEAAYEINGAMVRYDGFRLWTGVRWLHPNINHQTLFPQPGDFFRGLTAPVPEPEDV